MADDLKQLLLSFSDQSNTSVSDLIHFLAAQSDPENQHSEVALFQTLTQLRRFLTLQSDQAVFDRLMFEFPKAVSEFGGASERCWEAVEGIIERFIAMCGARDMLDVLCEALDSLTKKGECLPVYPCKI